MTLKYATITQFANILGINNRVPSWQIGTNPTTIKEEVGTGDDSETVFYLDNPNILADSYVLYYGATQATTTTLTETTHYTLDKTYATITLTGAGVTLLSTNKIFATYSYINNGMSNDYLSEVLGRAEQEVDDSCNTTFTDGTATNPDYSWILREKHNSQLYSKPTYFSEERPLVDLQSTLADDIAIGAVEIEIAAGDGSKYPTSGYIIIDSEVISYTGITTDTFTGCTRGELGSTAAIHLADAEVHTTILEYSDTYSGGTPIWQILPWNTDVTVSNLGKVYIHKDIEIDNIEQDVADRVRISYYWGYDSIPANITRLALLYAKRQLIQDNIGKAMIDGRNEFSPEMFNADRNEIDMIVSKYLQLGIGNT